MFISWKRRKSAYHIFWSENCQLQSCLRCRWGGASGICTEGEKGIKNKQNNKSKVHKLESFFWFHDRKIAFQYFFWGGLSSDAAPPCAPSEPYVVIDAVKTYIKIEKSKLFSMLPGMRFFLTCSHYFDITLCFNNTFYRIFGRILRQFSKNP